MSNRNDGLEYLRSGKARKLIGITVTVVLILEGLFAFVEVPAPAYAVDEPLTNVGEASINKCVSRKIFGKSYQECDLIRFGSDGSIITNGIRLMDITTTLQDTILRRNSSYVVFSITDHQNSISVYYKIDMPDWKIKFWIRGFVQIPVTISFNFPQFDNFDGKRITKGSYLIDFSDAMASGHSIAYINKTNAILMELSGTFNIDPTISQITSGSGYDVPIMAPSQQRVLNISGRWLAFYITQNNANIKVTNTSAKNPATADWSTPKLLTNNEVISQGWDMVNNSTHIFEFDARNNGSASGRHTFRLFRFFPNGTLKVQIETKISSKGTVQSASIVLNATGYPYILVQEETSPGTLSLRLYKAKDKSGRQFDSPMEVQTGLRRPYAMYYCGTSLMCIVYDTDGETSTTLKLKRYDQTTQSLGSEQDLGSDFQRNGVYPMWGGVGGLDGTVHIAYDSNANSTIRYLNYTVGNVKKMRQVMGSSLNTAGDVTIVRNNETNALGIISILSNAIWLNKTTASVTFYSSTKIATLTGTNPGNQLNTQRSCLKECGLLYANGTTSSPVWFTYLESFPQCQPYPSHCYTVYQGTNGYNDNGIEAKSNVTNPTIKLGHGASFVAIPIWVVFNTDPITWVEMGVIKGEGIFRCGTVSSPTFYLYWRNATDDYCQLLPDTVTYTNHTYRLYDHYKNGKWEFDLDGIRKLSNISIISGGISVGLIEVGGEATYPGNSMNGLITSLYNITTYSGSANVTLASWTAYNTGLTNPYYWLAPCSATKFYFGTGINKNPC